MPRPRPFRQVDVFASGRERLGGNPVAVVLDGEDLTDAQLQRFATWTNLSETTFVLPPTDPRADYRVRIFTPSIEAPFAGHPTLGTCHAWLEAGGTPRDPAAIVQEGATGLVTIRRDAASGRLAFGAPPMLRSGPVEPVLAAEVAAALRLDPAQVLATEHVDNGLGWIAVLLPDADAVLAVDPGPIGDLDLGVVGPHPSGAPCAFEVRAFFPKDGVACEDPVTGSLNASVAQWLLATGRARAPYVVRQGTALGRSGRVHVDADPDGTVWIGGATTTIVTGTADL